ncbi:MAG: extracellular solute-binding protein [Planctomycetes bacterium]|nr:extracellular solute-binding protein [Planctomycetota bacterium]
MANAPFKLSRAGRRSRFFVHAKCSLLLAMLGSLSGCQQQDDRKVLTLWHQMVPAERVILNERIAKFEDENPQYRIRALYKETEELRSGFQAAALAGIGPELIYGPSDVLGAFHTMGIVQDMSVLAPALDPADFVDDSLTYLPSHDNPKQLALLQIPDRLGNHLALVYNRNLIASPPTTTDELIELGVKNTLDENKDGRNESYGLVWNFVEPFFAIPFLTGYGAWVFDDSGDPVPALDTPECVAAYELILSLQDKYGIVPRNCDYETADSLFKSGKAAMIINGDWSWADYLNTEGIDAVVAPLPIVSATGLPMAPMVSPKGYSLNAYATPESAAAAMKFVTFATSESAQRELMQKLKILPSRKALHDDPLLTTDPTLLASKQQFANGRMMPVDTELRAVWDAMRPHYQALLGGSVSPQEAAQSMQKDALRAIQLMNRKTDKETAVWAWQLAGILICGALVVWQRKSLLDFLPDFRRQPFAYLLIAPALATIFLTIVFPFFYNLMLSLSDMSLTNFQDWKIIGLANYLEVFSEAKFFTILFKTLIWTVVNVFFHVAIGVMLAIAINGPIRGKAIYRIFLIIPWAVPAYITALTWRSMFHYDYGAINLLASSWPINLVTTNSWFVEFFGSPPFNWLGEPGPAFAACIVANVWLGYPFMMVIALGGLQGIPHELYEAARIDGANRLQQFRNVTLPLLKPVLAPAITLGAIWTFNNLNVVWLVSNGGEPSDQTHILVSYVYKAVFNLYRYGYGAALSMVIFAMLLVTSLVSLHRSKATENVYG